jgi:transposase
MRRGRRARLEGIEQHDFDQLSKTTGNFRERRRYLAFAHIQAGETFQSAAKMVRVRERTLMNWVKKFRTQGLKGLQDRYGGGTQPLVPPEDYDNFRIAVLKLQSERVGGRIRAKDVGEIIQQRYGMIASETCIYETLKRVGLVWITSRSQHPKADIEAQETFKKSFERK